MAQLTRNSYFKNLLANEVFEGEPHKVEADYNTLKVTVETDEVGVLSVFQSIDSKTYNSYGDVFNITGRTHKQVHIKGRYVYVKYENGADNTGSFSLYSVLSKSVGAGVGVSEVLVTNEYLDVSGAVSVNGLNFDASGNLKVSGVSGGASGDVNVTNALLAVKDLSNIDQQRIQTDRILFDTDIIANRLHDISGSVHITNAELAVRDASAIELLGQIADGITVSVGTVDVSGNVYDATRLTVVDASAVALLENIYQATGNTEINTTPIAYSPVFLDLDSQGAVVWADSTENWTAPLNGENGWQYENTTAGGANAYFYSNTSLVAGGLEPDITLGSLMNMSFVANYRLLLDSNPNKKFYIAMTTKPTGSGDYYPGVFKSRKVYELPSSTVVSKGADFLFYAGTDITSFRRDLDHKEMALAISNGTCGSDEIIQFMSINVDSGTTVNQFSGILKECYFSTAGGTNRQVVFDNSISRKADLALSKLSVEMGTLQVNMGGFSFNGVDELLVTMPTNTNIKCNDAFLTHTVADTKNCLDVQVNNPLTDYSTETTLAAIKAQTDKFNFDTEDGVVFDLRTTVSNEVQVSIQNTPTVSLSGGTEVGLVAGTEVALAAGSQVELVNSEVSLVSGTTVGLSAGSIVGFDVGSVVGIAGDSVIGITGSVQTHNFASNNGTDWHHLASDANGRIITLSRTHDGNGNDITSTLNGTVRALDVSVSGVPLVEISGNVAVSASASQYGSYANLANNVATILPAGVTSGIDVSAWSYFVGAYQDYYSGTAPTGSLRLQYSFDNSVYYDLFNTTISPSGAGTPRTATIQKQDIPAINWIRFKNDTNQTMASVTITLLGASLS